MSANGQLHDYELTSVGGGLRLRKDAAEAFLAMNREAPVHIRDAYRPLGHPGDLDRGVWSQWAAWERYQRDGSPQAAEPGSSNHGWGTAIDLRDPSDRATLDRIGAKYGFSKSWSDAPGEWWHILYEPGHYHPDPDPHHYLWFPVAVSILGMTWNARYIVQQYDKLRAQQTPKLHPNRVLLAKYRVQLRALAGRASRVANMSRPPAWNDSRHLRFQRDEFLRRANGERVV